MHIAIDARFLGPEGTGLGRYIEQLLLALEQVPSEHHFVVLLRPENIDLYQPSNDRFAKLLAPARWYTVREQLVIPRVLASANVDLVHFGHFNVPILSSVQKPFVVTVHDVIKHEHYDSSASTRSHIVHGIKHMAYGLTMRRAVLGASRIIVPSTYTKNKLGVLYPQVVERTNVIHEGVDGSHFSRPVSEAEKKRVADRYGITGRFLLYVGNSYPYKNVDLLLRSLQQLPSDIALVNPCARSVFYDRLEQKAASLGLSRRVVLPGYVPDDDLRVLYAMAAMYVFPSFSEGFGLPLLEAMAAGLPVISSNAASLPEVGGDACLYADPHSVEEFTGSIIRLLDDARLRTTLVERGRERVQQFLWKTTAEQTLAVYDAALSHNM